jgi:hypothetical protein
MLQLYKLLPEILKYLVLINKELKIQTTKLKPKIKIIIDNPLYLKK